ncbi:MAG: molybdate ABC transporter permease subunit [Nitritalea sp.]
MSDFDLLPFYLSFKLAAYTTIGLFFIGLPLAYWLVFRPKRYKVLLEALIGLPLVLPPTVLGFYLLSLWSPEAWLGGVLAEYFNIRLLFTFPGLVIASMLYSLPFMLQPLQAGFRAFPETLVEAAYALGKSPWTTFWRVILPNSLPALLSAGMLTFAHTIGEFGVILMVGGSIPGETKVVAISIYDEVEALNYAAANRYAFILLLFSFLVLLIVYSLNYRHQKFLRLL